MVEALNRGKTECGVCWYGNLSFAYCDAAVARQEFEWIFRADSQRFHKFPSHHVCAAETMI